MRGVGWAISVGLSLVPMSASGAEPGDPSVRDRLQAARDTAVELREDLPWVRLPAPVPTVAPDPEAVAPYRVGDMMHAGTPSAPVSPALSGPRGALIYVAMDGVTLRPCDNPNLNNSARSCTSMVDALTEFPAWGNAGDRAAMTQQLRAYFDAFDVHVTTERPPDYMPYSLQVVGGVPGLIGASGLCGLGNLECGGDLRNRVGLSFAHNPNCTPTKTIAHEAGHNFGLEHTDHPNDIMSYTVIADGTYAFVNPCAPMFEPSDRINCPARHAVHCPDSGGTTQSSHAELLGALGPRRVDTGPPEIVDVTPADGSVFTVNDVVLVGARVVEDGTFVGARWTWLGGLPEELPFGHDRCTNGVCADDFGSDGDPDADYEYLLLVGPPVGQYVFAFEVMDSAGQEASTTVSFRVVAPPPPPMPWPPTPPDDDEPDEPPPPRSDPFDDDDALPLDYGDDASEALGCRSGGGPPSPWAGWWLLAVARGRRAIRRRGRADDPPRRG